MSQLTEIVHQATGISHKRNSKTLGLESILFLMRQSPLKIQRLVKYLTAKDISRQTKADVDGEVDQSGRVGIGAHIGLKSLALFWSQFTGCHGIVVMIGNSKEIFS